MSQYRDECQQMNWSSIRHIWGKLFAIKEICARFRKHAHVVRMQCQGQSDPKWYAPIPLTKRNPHTKNSKRV